jgi:hypothetical protein
MYVKQKIPCGGTDAQDISDSIYMRHLMCMFDVVVHSRCRKMYAAQSLERSLKDEQQNRRSAASRTDEASSREYPPEKPDRPHTRGSVPQRTAISEACSPTLFVLAEGGMRTCCLQRV